jgi:hypothetical protein
LFSSLLFPRLIKSNFLMALSCPSAEDIFYPRWRSSADVVLSSSHVFFVFFVFFVNIFSIFKLNIPSGNPPHPMWYASTFFIYLIARTSIRN